MPEVNNARGHRSAKFGDCPTHIFLPEIPMRPKDARSTFHSDCETFLHFLFNRECILLVRPTLRFLKKKCGEKNLSLSGV